MTSVINWVKNLPRKTIFSILLSFVLSLVVVRLLFPVGTAEVNLLTESVTFHISEEFQDFTLFIETTGTNYFHSIGEVSVCFWSPYSQYLSNSTLELSLDGYNWVEMQFSSLEPDIDKFTNYKKVGLIELNKLHIQLHGRQKYQAQIESMPENLTRSKIIDSINGHIRIRAVKSPRDQIVGMLIIMSFYHAILRIIDMVFLRKQ